MKTTLILAALLSLTACNSVTTTVTEFDDTGKPVRQTVTADESMVKSFLETTKNKTVFISRQGWFAGLMGTVASTEDPTPTFKVIAGKSDDLYASFTDTAIRKADSLIVQDIFRSMRQGAVGVSQNGIQGGAK